MKIDQLNVESSREGTIFEIREFSLFDGPGIRTTVFLKGCPLHCLWCHNPEGISPKKELLVNSNQCRHCGACQKICTGAGTEAGTGANCQGCGRCVSVCPEDCRRIAGRSVSVEDLVEELLKGVAIFQTSGGGVTFSGGEPLFQADFTANACKLLRSRHIHCAVETSGYASPEKYRTVVENVDLVFQDLKHPDPNVHRQYTGCSNEPILNNLKWLKASGIPFIARIPLIPGVNMDHHCMMKFSELLVGTKSLIRVELLPYHTTAGAKYHLLGLQYPFIEPKEKMEPDLTPFLEKGITIKIM